MVDEINEKVNVDTERAVRNVNRLTSAFLRFRDSIALTKNSFNAIINSAAVLFRRLARIRTAFFILVTFLAARPLVAFFQDLTNFSVDAQEAVFRLQQRFNSIKTVLGDALAPLIEVIGNQLLSLLEEILRLLTNPAAFAIIQSVAQSLDKIVKTLGIAVSILGIIFKAAGVIRAEFLLVATGIGKVYTTIFRAIATGIDNILNDIRGLAGILAAAGLGSASQKIISSLKNISSSIKDVSVAFDDAIGEAAQGNLDDVKDKFGGLLKSVDEFIAKLPDFGEQLTTNAEFTVKFLEGVKEAVKEIERDLVNAGTVIANTSRGFFEGFRRGLNRFRQRTLQEFADKLAAGILTAFETGFGDILFAVMDNRLDDIKDLVTSFLRDIQKELARFASRQFVTGLLNVVTQIGASGFGSIFSSGATPETTATPSESTGAPGGFIGRRQEGGLFSTPTLLAEGGGVEAAVPLRRGRIPVDLQGLPSTSAQVTINISAVDGRSVASILNRPESKTALAQIISEGLEGGNTRLRSAVTLLSNR